MLSVGDRVIVRDDLKPDEVYGSIMFVESMSKFKNEEVEIIKVLQDADITYYKIDIDDDGYNWSESMFQGVVVFEDKEVASEEEIGLLFE